MKTLGNILWIIFGGFVLSLMWVMAGLILCVTIIGIPFGIQCFKLATLIIMPFGKKVIFSGGVGSFLMNILWIIFFGWELAVMSVVVGLLWCLTVIGIPIGLQCFKFAQLSLMPFGAVIT